MMTTCAYYNENDPQKAAWLRELIRRNLIAPGDVDERSIKELRASDLGGYAQCHFFAGIGVWSYALRCAGWSDDRPIWTGSCPCQPFSVAGQQKGFDDDRHLWPAWFDLIAECLPITIIGEEVAGKNGLTWLDNVQSDLEYCDYICGAVVVPACGFGAPHRRERLYFMAHNISYGEKRTRAEEYLSDAGREISCMAHDQCAGLERATGEIIYEFDDGSAHSRSKIDLGNDAVCDLGIASSIERGSGRIIESSDQQDTTERSFDRGNAGTPNTISNMAFSDGRQSSDGDLQRSGEQRLITQDSIAIDGDRRPSPTNGFWADADWIKCRDGKWRAVEPGTFPLAYGAPARMGRLRGYGDAIVAPQAQAFIEAVMDVLDFREQ